jgi:hypothetical protein
MNEPTPFANTSRIGIDACNVDQRSLQNTQMNNYNLQNFFLQDCGMKKPIEFATNQPAVNFKGGHLGAGGCNVDDSSDLLYGSMQTHPKTKLDLLQRPFMTVPYLGRGSVNSVEESQLQQGERETNRRSANKLSEYSYATHTQTPLIHSISSRVTDPAHSIEEVALDGWVRGGIDSRQLTRDIK